MFKKIIASVLMLTLIITVFSGCTSKDVLKLFAIDPDEIDPATVKVVDVLNEKNKAEGKELVTAQNPEAPIEVGELTYTLYSDKTASVAGWKYEGTYDKDVPYGAGDEIPEALKEEKNPIKHKKGDPLAKELVIPSEIKANGEKYKVIGIENKAFYGNKYLGELVIADSVEIIGNYAVMYCTNLQKLTIGKNVRDIGYGAFQAESKKPYESYSNLKEIVWKGAPEIISEKAFYFNDEITEIDLPKGVKYIGPWAFSKCVKVEDINLPEGLEEIHDHAFHKCIAVKNLVLPGSCKVIDVSTFYQCKALEKITINDGVTTLAKGAFEECEKLTSVELPQSVKDIGKYAFYNCLALKEVKYSKDATVDDDAFKDVPNVKEIKY